MKENMINSIYRLLSDIESDPKAYSPGWIQKDGLPYWYDILATEPKAQLVIDKYESIVADAKERGLL